MLCFRVKWPYRIPRLHWRANKVRNYFLHIHNIGVRAHTEIIAVSISALNAHHFHRLYLLAPVYFLRTQHTHNASARICVLPGRTFALNADISYYPVGSKHLFWILILYSVAVFLYFIYFTRRCNVCVSFNAHNTERSRDVRIYTCVWAGCVLTHTN